MIPFSAIRLLPTNWEHILYCDGFSQSIARQRLGKHSRGKEYATTVCPVLGNVAVTRLYTNPGNRRKCFLCGPTALYNENEFAAKITLVQRSTKSRTTKTWIGESCLSSGDSAVQDDCRRNTMKTSNWFEVIVSVLEIRCQETDSMS
jgi:hypothetical protein